MFSCVENVFAKGRSVKCEVTEVIIILYNSVQIVTVVYYTVSLLYGSYNYFVVQKVLTITRTLYIVLLNFKVNLMTKII